MQNTERQKFEESWKKAFDGAQSTPPDHVWNSIELDLAGQESAAMKKEVVFYRRLAAAMLIFGLLAGAYGFYASSGNSDGAANDVLRATNDVKGATSSEHRSTNDTKNSTSNEHRATNDGNDSGSIQKENPIAPTTQKKQKQIQEQIQREAQHLAFAEPDETTQELKEKETAAEESAVVTETKKEEEKKVTELIISPLLQQQEETPQTVVEPKRSKRQKESLWLALGGSAGNYTPNTPTATTPTFSQSSFALKGPALDFSTMAAPKPQPKVGSSYSVGVGVGKKFGRFVLQTGVNLNKQQINYISNYDARTPSNTTVAAMSDYIGQSSDLTITNEYTVSSTMDIVSIPVQAGYMIIDRRLGWQINAGVSNDFFLRNVLIDKSGQRSRFTQEAGSESPYRSVNWSALASTELSYRIGQHYRISLVPGARYSMHSILKNDKDTGRPVILDVGFRFRYIFD